MPRLPFVLAFLLVLAAWAGGSIVRDYEAARARGAERYIVMRGLSTSLDQQQTARRIETRDHLATLAAHVPTYEDSLAAYESQWAHQLADAPPTPRESEEEAHWLEMEADLGVTREGGRWTIRHSPLTAVHPALFHGLPALVAALLAGLALTAPPRR